MIRNLEAALIVIAELVLSARALIILLGVRARARWRIRWRSRLRERLNRCRVAVVLGRWVYSLVCEPAYRPMRWLVSQRTPWPLSRGFSRSPLFPCSYRRFLPAPLRWRTSLRVYVRAYVYMCACTCVRVHVYVCRFASRAIIVTGGTPLARARLKIARDTGSTTDEARSSQSIAINGGSIVDSRDPDQPDEIQRRSTRRADDDYREYLEHLIIRRTSRNGEPEK